MRAVWFAVAAVFVSVLGSAFAQGPGLLPPVAPGPGEGPPLPGGKEVSQPLTPVEIPPTPTLVPQPNPDPQPDPVQRVEDVQQQKPTRHGPLGPDWDDMSFLLWWPKAAPVPPLVTATRFGAPPVLGGPSTTLFVGSHSLATPAVSGGRFLLGWAIDEGETVGFELGYFFLGSRTNRLTISELTNPRMGAVGLPFLNAITGREDVFLTAAPGIANGSVYTTTTTRAQGAEANFVANLYDNKGVRLNAIVGYRYLQVYEGLTVEQARYTATNFGPIYDQFDGHNRFNGGQVGLHADLSRGIVFCELTGKVALGETFEVVKIDGTTGIHTPVLGGVTNQVFAGGVYALPSNIGRYTRNAFAVVPEGIVKLGLKLSDSGRLYVGYNFLYLSDLVRPGDQIDRTLNPAQIPSLNPGGVAILGPDRPRPMITRSDFWAQGLIVGLETRY